MKEREPLLTFQGDITVPGYAAAKGGIGQLTKAHRQHRGAAQRSSALSRDSRQDPRGPLGIAGRFRRSGGVPGLRRVGLCERHCADSRRRLDGPVARQSFWIITSVDSAVPAS